ncbi:MAG: SpoIID/LytB domain-containing protein [Planctomycetota bacterium]|nr:SpoIID/LytB domain-containing protein [Planctomycetota bacterium]MDA1114377.1 SpoIID/LytB domain-containing protein [Planctomycetota bacterium]
MNPLAKRLGITLVLFGILLGIGHYMKEPVVPEADTLTDAPLLNPVIEVRLMSLSGNRPIPIQIAGRWKILDGARPEHPVLHPGSGGFEGNLFVDSTGPQLGPYRTNSDHVIVTTEASEALWLDTFLYPGKLHIRTEREKSGHVIRLNLSLEMPLEDYVMGVVCGEMSSMQEGVHNALCAQAIAARTYALQKRGSKRGLRDDTFDQVFLGLDYRTTQAEAAIEATRGLVMQWDNALLPAFFHANCGGGTANALEAGFSKSEVAPLQGTLEPACRTPREIWERVISAEQLDGLAQRYRIGEWLQGISTIKRDASGRLLEVRLLGNEEHEDLAGERLRAALSLPSMQLVEVEVRIDGSAIFRGHGFGHGVGMCQTGAVRISRGGSSFQDILQHYYPEAELVPLTSELRYLLPPPQ